MSNVSKKYRNPKKVAAIELFGLNPDITTKEVAEKLENIKPGEIFILEVLR